MWHTQPEPDKWLVTNQAGAQLAEVRSADFLGALTRACFVNAVRESQHAEGVLGLVRVTGEQEHLQFPDPSRIEQHGPRFWVWSDLTAKERRSVSAGAGAR